MAKQKGVKPVAANRRARHDYFVEETYECGLALHGTEVKSIRQGHVSLKESFARIKDGEAFVCTGMTDEGEWEVLVAKDGNEISTEHVYQGVCASETGFEPGTYTVTVTAKAATGTVNVLAYPAGTIDFENLETEDVIATVQDYINANG